MPYVRVTSSRNHGGAPLHQLLLTLRFYAGTILIFIADFVGVSKSTAGRIIRDITSGIASLYDKYIFVNLEGARLHSYPHTVTIHVIDEEFRNHDGSLSLKGQAVCDADLKFINVVARLADSAHDTTIFDNSVLRGFEPRTKNVQSYHLVTESKAVLHDIKQTLVLFITSY